ncbi:MAG: glycosyltransferase family 2 protein [Deltaproteobacteria bacterium]|nr:glycosyltransferase family 2 protein [Deltaproteobacteria bacterium]
MEPLFSVVIPTFNNRGPYLLECVQSALGQTYQDVEVVIDDNASNDGTCELLTERFGGDSRLKLFPNKEDLNIPEGWNRAIRHAKGKYVVLLHSDNVIHSQYCEIMVELLERYQDKVAYSECNYFEGETPENIFAPVLSSKHCSHDRLTAGARAVAYMFRFQRMIPTSCTAFCAEVLKERDAYDRRFRWDPDMEWIASLARKYGVIRVAHDLAAIRTHDGQARSWKDPTFSEQYRELLSIEHTEGRTEEHHFLMDWAASNQDICRTLSKLSASLPYFGKYWWRWFKAEQLLWWHFHINYMRKMKYLVVCGLQYLQRKAGLVRPKTYKEKPQQTIPIDNKKSA